MATYDDLHSRVLRTLNDPSAKTYGDALVYDAICAAHDAILPWVPRTALAEVTSGSDGISITLPADVYIVQAVQNTSTGEFIPKATMAPLTVRYTDSAAQDWIDYPYGYLTLSRELEQDVVIKLHYLSYWAKPASESDSTFVIQVPSMAHQGMVYYASSHALTPRAVNSASIRQFNQRVDSGDPEDNPLKAEADWMLGRFIQEMKMMPAYTKVGM